MDPLRESLSPQPPEQTSATKAKVTFLRLPSDLVNAIDTPVLLSNDVKTLLADAEETPSEVWSTFGKFLLQPELKNKEQFEKLIEDIQIKTHTVCPPHLHQNTELGSYVNKLLEKGKIKDYHKLQNIGLTLERFNSYNALACSYGLQLDYDYSLKSLEDLDRTIDEKLILLIDNIKNDKALVVTNSLAENRIFDYLDSKKIENIIKVIQLPLILKKFQFCKGILDPHRPISFRPDLKSPNVIEKLLEQGPLLDEWIKEVTDRIRKFVRCKFLNNTTLGKEIYSRLDNINKYIESGQLDPINEIIKIRTVFDKQELALSIYQTLNTPSRAPVPPGLSKDTSINAYFQLDHELNEWFQAVERSGLALTVKTISLKDKSLFSLSPYIQIFTNLEELDLSGNYLTHIPLECINLVNLKTLDLSNNEFIEVPIGFNSSLKKVDFRNNKFPKN